MFRLVLLSCLFAGCYCTPGGSPIRHYAFSYATPDGQARYETSTGGNVNGGYQYRTPEGAVVAVRYSADEHGYRAIGDNFIRHNNLPGSFRRAYSYTYSGFPYSRPVVKVTPHETVIPSIRYVLPYSYYYGYPYYNNYGGYQYGFPYAYHGTKYHTVPTNLKYRYNTAKVSYEPVESHGYVISY